MTEPVQACEVMRGDVFDSGGPGTVQYLAGGNPTLRIKCPRCGEAVDLPLNNCSDPNARSWSLEQRDPITLSPSIHHDVKRCDWHGWLKEGVFS